MEHLDTFLTVPRCNVASRSGKPTRSLSCRMELYHQASTAMITLFPEIPLFLIIADKEENFEDKYFNLFNIISIIFIGVIFINKRGQFIHNHQYN
jgi:hypothetical protein